MALIIDRRCPACNNPVIGKQEVVTLTRVSAADKKIAKCSSCETNIGLIQLTDELTNYAFDYTRKLNGRYETEPMVMPAAESNTKAPAVPKTRKSRSPKQEQQMIAREMNQPIVLKPYFKSAELPKKGEAGFAYAQHLSEQGMSEEAVLAKRNAALGIKTKETEVFRPYPTDAAEKAKTSPTATVIANEVGVEVAAVSRGSKTSYPIFGHSHTKFFLWAGQSQWSVSEVQTALKAFGLPEISVLSIRTFLYAGRKGGTGPKACAGRGEAPKYTPEQVKSLEIAAGKAQPEPTKTIAVESVTSLPPILTEKGKEIVESLPKTKKPRKAK